MNMTSRFTLLAGVAGAIWAGCSSPAGEGDIAPAPTTPPPGIASGQAGADQQLPQGGTGGGGGAPAVTAGTGGSGVTAGTGGSAMAAAGAGGGGGTIPTGSGNIVMHDGTGWVPGSSNGLGIQGSFYSFGDFTTTPPGTTTAELGDFAASPTSACISGVASQVLTPDGATQPAFGQYWGGGIGLNLADPGNMTGPGPWDRQTVTGFSFNVTGPAIPPGAQLRFKVTTLEGATVNENGYCTTAAAGANSFQFGTLVNECWDGGAGEPALGAATPIVALQWQVATVTAEPTPFDFCIENLTALTAP